MAKLTGSTISVVGHAIRPLLPDGVVQFDAHFLRHRAESGRGDHHFMPFTPDDPDGPSGLNVDALNRELTELGWQRWFVALDEENQVIGHVDLKGDGLKTGCHRCELGIGIERKYRSEGLGRRLMETAIEFARQIDSIVWVDLRVFAHNSAARALYVDMGFSDVGVLVDRFRIEGQVIDDVIMTLKVG